VGSRWVDLLDPDRSAIEEAVGLELHETAWHRLLAPSRLDRPARPRLEQQDSYVFGVLSIPVRIDGQVTFREVDLIASPERLVTIRKTPAEGDPYHCRKVQDHAERHQVSVGMALYLLIDEVAEEHLDLIDEFDDEIDKLEDHLDEGPSTSEVREKISILRHDMLHVRRTLAPTRDLARSVLDDRVELEGVELFPRDVELRFADAYDKLLRATDGLDLARDLLAGVRDYHQAQVSIEQNEVMKRLTVVASVLLLPTFIVGLYGQNFHHMPELGLRYGYGLSWLIIILSTIGQLVYFRRKKWI